MRVVRDASNARGACVAYACANAAFPCALRGPSVALGHSCSLKLIPLLGLILLALEQRFKFAGWRVVHSFPGTCLGEVSFPYTPFLPSLPQLLL